MAHLSLTSRSASVTVDADRGGRLAGLMVDGHQLLVVEAAQGAMQWGSYPMVPFAGRLAAGRFRFGGELIELPINLAPHAIHGFGYTSAWRIVDHQTLSLDLGAPWPFPATVTQRFELDDAGLTMTMAATAAVDMPIQLGWHPWFRRELTGAAGEPVGAELRFGPAAMYEIDDVAIPTGRLIATPEGPWDNCFTELAEPPRITWPGLIELTLTSDCDHWVVFTEPANALCVEPQTSAPDVFNRDPEVLAAGTTRTARFRIAWG
ncbi:MAG: aldose 1-epimerase [Actinomycetota bacterium]